MYSDKNQLSFLLKEYKMKKYVRKRQLENFLSKQK